MTRNDAAVHDAQHWIAFVRLLTLIDRWEILKEAGVSCRHMGRQIYASDEVDPEQLFRKCPGRLHLQEQQTRRVHLVRNAASGPLAGSPKTGKQFSGVAIVLGPPQVHIEVERVSLGEAFRLDAPPHPILAGDAPDLLEGVEELLSTLRWEDRSRHRFTPVGRNLALKPSNGSFTRELHNRPDTCLVGFLGNALIYDLGVKSLDEVIASVVVDRVEF
jgi:hypothetical protein